MTPLEFAHLPDVSGPRYGFHRDRPGGPIGITLPFVRSTGLGNCITFTGSYLFHEAKMRGVNVDKMQKAWETAVLSTSSLERRGSTQAAVMLGLAQDVARLEPGDHLAPGWYVTQGWVTEGKFKGHGVFLHVLPGARPSQILVLEARGQTDANGGPLKGQDGVSSRCCTPPNVRDWPAGKWGEVVDVWTVERLLATWQECYVARLPG